MQFDQIKSVTHRATETTIAVSLVLVFFLALLALLNLVFPSGEGIKALVGGSEWTDGDVAGSPGRRMKSRGFDQSDPVAKLTDLKNEVKARKGASIAWGAANSGMDLHDQDAIQTFTHARASLNFSDKGKIHLGQNTHIVISGGHDDFFSEKENSSLIMMDGLLRGALEGRNGDPVDLEIILPHGTARLQSEDVGGETVDFQIQVNKESTASILVEKGTAIVTAGEDTVAVRSEEYTTIGPDTAPTKPRVIAPAIHPRTPDDGQVFEYRSLSPKIDFAWDDPSGLLQYHFVLCTDPELTEIVHEDFLNVNYLTRGNLKAGTYYWGVFGLEDGMAITKKKARRLRLTRTMDAPGLSVVFPEGDIRDDHVVITGTTEPEIIVQVGDQKTTSSRTGLFEVIVKLKPGLNVIVVEAIDELGNTAYQSKVLNRR